MNKIILADNFQHLDAFVSDIDNIFNGAGEEIHSGRNVLKVFKENDVELCVKSFGKPTLANTFIYSYIRQSKAERSFKYAQKLLGLGIHTPKPVAYVEVCNHLGILQRSYYISLYDRINYTMSTVLDESVPNKKLILEGFVKFMINDLHAKGVYHKDFNGGNVLVTKNDDSSYTYTLVDLNRISFSKAIAFHKGLRNLHAISSNPMYLAELAHYYSVHHKEDTDETIYELLLVKYLNNIQRRYTKRILHSFKSIL